MWVLCLFDVCQRCVCVQVKRLEVLLTKCKETIKANKERTQQLVSDKETTQKQLELLTQEHDLLKVTCVIFLLCFTFRVGGVFHYWPHY